MQPEKVAEARSWLDKAHDDLRAADLDLRASAPLIGDALFHCQQAIEKVFKGFLTWHSRPFRKVHDLREIGGAVLAVDPSMESLVHRVVPVSPFATAFRYPFPAAEPTESEAEETLSLAREVYEAILARLPGELRPTGPCEAGPQGG